MGDLGSGISSVLGGLGNVLNPAGAAQASTNPNIFGGQGGDQSTMDFSNAIGDVVDPTGSVTATNAITGGAAADQGVAGQQDIGGEQSDYTGQPQRVADAQQPPPQQQQHPPAQKQDQPETSDRLPQGVAGPVGWQQADRFRSFAPPGTYDKPPQLPDWVKGGQRSMPSPQTAQTGPPQAEGPQGQPPGMRPPGMQGGQMPPMMPRLPGPLGGLISNILGIMGGNPQSLGGIVGNAMRGGMQGGPGGGMSPFGVPWTSLPMAPGWSYDANTGQYHRTPGSQPGVPTPRSGQRYTQGPSAGEARQTARELGPAAQPDPQQVARVGQTAAAPLTGQEARVPAWSVGGQGGGPSMRPTQPSVDRSRFANENNDQMAYRAAWMVNGEIGLNRDPRNQIVQLETAFNRAHYRNHSLGQALLDTRSGGGYYDGTSPTPTYRISARPTPEQFQKFKREVWDPVMQGSNLSDIGWGPMTGNASGGLAQRQMGRMQGYSTGSGESYFREMDGSRMGRLPAIQQRSPFLTPQAGEQPAVIPADTFRG